MYVNNNSILIREPNLLIPGKKPVGNELKINSQFDHIRWIVFPDKPITRIIGVKQIPVLTSIESIANTFPVITSGNLFNTANIAKRSNTYSHDYVYAADANCKANSEFTLMCHFRLLLQSTYSYLFGSYSGTYYLGMFTSHANAAGRCGIFCGTGTTGVLDSLETLSINNEYVLVARRNVTGVTEFFLNGKKTSAIRTGNTLSAGSTTQLVMNSFDVGSDYGCVNDTYMVAFIDKAYDNGKCIELSKNPYILFE